MRVFSVRKLSISTLMIIGVNLSIKHTNFVASFYVHLKSCSFFHSILMSVYWDILNMNEKLMVLVEDLEFDGGGGD